MKKIFQAASVCLAAAVIPVHAAPKISFQFVSDGAGADMTGGTSTHNYSLYVSETTQKGTNKFEGVSLNFYLCGPDEAGSSAVTCLYGSGSIPLDAMQKVAQGRSAPTLVSLSVRDLNAIPSFFLWSETCNPVCQSILPPSPFPISVVVKSTSQTKTDEDVSRTTEFYTEDGTQIKEVIRGRTISSSAVGTAKIGGVALDPNNSARTFDDRSVLHVRSVSKVKK
jgi:hypothetical protein